MNIIKTNSLSAHVRLLPALHEYIEYTSDLLVSMLEI